MSKMKVKPLFSDVLVSLHLDKAESDLIIPDSAKTEMISDIQEVLAVGAQCSQVKVGDQVRVKLGEVFKPVQKEIRQTSMEYDTRVKTEWVLDQNRLFTIDGVDCLLIREGSIAYRILRPDEIEVEEQTDGGF